MNQASSSFSDFTNLYELSKTLRFELKPMGETLKMLEENEVFKKDELIQKKYEETKKYFDQLHREFVKESLQDAKLSDLEKYNEALKNAKNITRETTSKDRKDLEAILEKEEKRLRKEIVALFNAKAKEWSERYLGLKNKDLKILDEEAVFSELLKVRYGDNPEAYIDIEKINKKTGEIIKEKVSIFDEWKGFTGYFTKFFETRKNFYKDDGTSTALATRIIDQNLRRFCDNLQVFEKVKEKLNFSEVEKNFDKQMSEIFSLDFYNKCILQNGIDFYNKILGGETLDNGEKLKGVNELINKYRQDHKGEKLPFLKTLDKQILSEKEKFIEEIEDDKDLLRRLKTFHKNAEEKIQIIQKIFENLEKDNWDEKELAEIYISKEAFGRTLTHSWTDETELFEKVVFEAFKTEKDGRAKYTKAEDKYTFPNSIPLKYIKNGLNTIGDSTKFWKDRYYKDEEDKTNEGFLVLSEIDIWNEFLQIFVYEFSSLFEKTINKGSDKEKIIGYEHSKKGFINFLDTFDVNKKTTKEQKIIIKDFADDSKKIYQMANYFTVEKKRKWNPEHLNLGDFYTNPEFGYEIFHTDAYEQIVKPYDLFRNYLTKKPWESVQKWKLNFENSTLADGWDKNKETDNFAIILQKDGKYFLGLMKKGYNHLLIDKNKEKFKGEGYKKMVYKLLPGANKMLPKVFFSKSNINFFAPSEKVLEIRNYSSHSKSGNPQKGYTKKEFNLQDCHTLIDFFKSSLAKHEEWKNFNFNFSETSTYKDISGFYREVEQGGYKISFQNISEKYIEEKNQNGELYLFQIKNKDFELDKSIAPEGYIFKGGKTKNLHTLYFENLFSDENIAKNFIFKLNGQAEIFYRPKAIEAKKVKRNFTREIVEKKRYTEDKTFFHVPMTLNRGKGNAFYFNRNLNKFLANNSDINIIGVDRGEKHLAYYSVINQNQEILESGTLNTMKGGNGKDVDYHQKLEEKAKDREQARKDWQDVQGIKDLKKGYISQVVRKLADLAIQHNAIIVFEDLNMRFKQIRGGIEKSVYQQLEKALIEKLNFLVNKGETDPEKTGHLLKAYQLTAPFETFQKMGKQTGILFYTTASYTSKIDPVTGWRPNLYLKKGNAKINKENILKFSKIKFVNERFEFIYDLRNFINSEKAKFPKKTEWTVCSSVERFRWNRKLNNNKGGYDYYENLTDEFKKLFGSVDIDISRNILEQIKDLEIKGNEKFFSDFIFLFGLVCQIRNTNQETAGDDNDFILSPVAPFFDSRKDNGKKLPKNGDDNGAFNIARKGVLTLKKINEWVKENGELKQAGGKEKYSPDLFISNTDWDNFAQKST